MIDVEHITKRFGRLVAVNDLSLSVPAGEIFCFLGPNGAGKTTTIKMMTGLLKPTSGVGRIAGIDVQTDPVEAKRRMGYIPDMPYLYDRLTTEDFFRFTGDLYGITREKAERELDGALVLFGMSDYRSVLIKDLSHGMRQRLIYAATLLHEPDVLFVDEPLIGLDPYSIRLIKDLLREKAGRGMTIFLTTHILALAEDIADRIGIILNGRLEALGTLEGLLEQNGGTNLEEMFLKLTAGNPAGTNRSPDGAMVTEMPKPAS